jgi:small GTP-binding protein
VSIFFRPPFPSRAALSFPRRPPDAPPMAPKRKPATEGGGAMEMKVVLVGAVGVGKTSTVTRFTKNTFMEYCEATIGASYMAKDLEVDGQRVRFSIWDTAGQEQYHSLVPMYFRQAAAVILVYDITKKPTFQEAKEWVQEIRKNAPADVLIALAGNKCDLEGSRQVPAADAEEFAASIGGFHIETGRVTKIEIPALETMFHLLDCVKFGCLKTS